MPSTKKGSSIVRKPVYEYLELLLGRKLTVPEHNALKEILLKYVEHEEGKIQELESIIQRQATRNRNISTQLYNMYKKKGIPEENIAFLKEVFETTA